MATINTHGLVIDFGRHKGVLYTRAPVSYLKWMVNTHHSRADIAEAELQRRGTVTPNLEISGHAIDTASLRCRHIWHETRRENEGLHAWLVRVSEEALSLTGPQERIQFHGMTLIFEHDGIWPVLKTVTRQKVK